MDTAIQKAVATIGRLRSSQLLLVVVVVVLPKVKHPTISVVLHNHVNSYKTE